MNSQVRDAHWSLWSIWTRTNMISKVSSVFDAALRTVSAALLLSSCLSEFLLPGSLVMSFPGKFMEPFLLGQSIMVVAGYRIPNRKHEAQALFGEPARLSIQYFALLI